MKNKWLLYTTLILAVTLPNLTNATIAIHPNQNMSTAVYLQGSYPGYMTLKITDFSYYFPNPPGSAGNNIVYFYPRPSFFEPLTVQDTSTANVKYSAIRIDSIDNYSSATGNVGFKLQATLYKGTDTTTPVLNLNFDSTAQGQFLIFKDDILETGAAANTDYTAINFGNFHAYARCNLSVSQGYEPLHSPRFQLGCIVCQVGKVCTNNSSL